MQLVQVIVQRWTFILFFNDTATTEIYTLSLHDALPISSDGVSGQLRPLAPSTPAAARATPTGSLTGGSMPDSRPRSAKSRSKRSEEHTSELQSRQYLVCRLLLEKKK